MQHIRVWYSMWMIYRHKGIEKKYRIVHDRGGIVWKIISQIYLVILNIEYYLFHKDSLDEFPELEDDYLEKRKQRIIQEQQTKDINSLVNALQYYDIISFDVFDTLIFRPFDKPTDLFYLLQKEFSIKDLHNLRKDAEVKARKIKQKREHNSEVTLLEIWAELERLLNRKYIIKKHGCLSDESISRKGYLLEYELEYNYCFANPYMKAVFKALIEKNKTIIITSDMYLDEVFLRKILKKNGICGYDQIFVSSEYGCSKVDGGLYEVIADYYNKSGEKKIIHVGDNELADVQMAQKRGIDAFWYVL